MVVLMSKTSLLLITITILYFFQPVSSCSSARLQKKVKRPYDRPKITRRGSCVNGSEFVHSLCRNFNTNNKTYYPNILKHESLQTAFSDLQSWWALSDIKCSPDTELLFCSTFLPQCTIPNTSKRPKMLLPCRSVCESVRDGCGGNLTKYTGHSWFPAFRCDLFPTGGGCLQGKGTPVEEQKNNSTKIIKEVQVNSDVYITVKSNKVDNTSVAQGEAKEEARTQAVSAGEKQTNEFNQNSTKTIKEVQVKNDIYLIVETSEDKRGVTNEAEMEGRVQNAQDVKKQPSCKNSTRGSKPEGTDPNEKDGTDRDGPTECAKGHYQCRHSSVKSYMNGVVHCCFYQKQIAHTVTVDNDDGGIKSACSCSYPSPKLSDDC